MADLTDTLRRLDTTRAVVAAEIGISRQHLYEIARGKSDPTAPVIARLLGFLNQADNLKRLGRRRPVTFEELFGDAARPGRAA